MLKQTFLEAVEAEKERVLLARGQASQGKNSQGTTPHTTQVHNRLPSSIVTQPKRYCTVCCFRSFAHSQVLLLWPLLYALDFVILDVDCHPVPVPVCLSTQGAA